jgi:hypothetical protein
MILLRSNADDLQKRGVLQSESTKDQQQQRVSSLLGLCCACLPHQCCVFHSLTQVTSARQTLGDFMASRPTPETLVKQKIIAGVLCAVLRLLCCLC